MKVIATGKINGKEAEIVWMDGTFVSADAPASVLSQLNTSAVEGRTVGGTSYLDSESPLLAQILLSEVFDSLPEIKAEDGEIPKLDYEEGVIY